MTSSESPVLCLCARVCVVRACPQNYVPNGVSSFSGPDDFYSWLNNSIIQVCHLCFPPLSSPPLFLPQESLPLSPFSSFIPQVQHPSSRFLSFHLGCGATRRNSSSSGIWQLPFIADASASGDCHSRFRPPPLLFPPPFTSTVAPILFETTARRPQGLGIVYPACAQLSGRVAPAHANACATLVCGMQPLWKDPYCGDGRCDEPLEFPAFGNLGCAADCGTFANLTTIRVVMSTNFYSEDDRAASSWNLCLVLPLNDCWYAYATSTPMPKTSGFFHCTCVNSDMIKPCTLLRCTPAHQRGKHHGMLQGQTLYHCRRNSANHHACCPLAERPPTVATSSPGCTPSPSLGVPHVQVPHAPEVP